MTLPNPNKQVAEVASAAPEDAYLGTKKIFIPMLAMPSTTAHKDSIPKRPFFMRYGANKEDNGKSQAAIMSILKACIDGKNFPPP